MEWVFWGSVFGICYSYCIYPAILQVLSYSISSRSAAPTNPITKGTVSVIVAAYNEEKLIRTKIENCLALENAGQDIEILIASDCSTDGTHGIVRQFSGRGVRLVISPCRLGKESAQWEAIQASSGAILVFTDAATVLKSDAVIKLLEAFSDPDVGAVSSVDRFLTNEGQVVGEGLYVRYEMWLRKLESQVGSLVGLSGSFFAARRDVCEAWDLTVPSDFGTAINCAKRGYKAVSDPSLVGIYKNVADSGREYQRKVRTITRGMQGLLRRKEVLNPFKFGFFSIQIWSHKVMRWLVPWFMFVAFASNLFLLHEATIYQLSLFVQFMSYLCAILPRVFGKARHFAILRIVNFFVEANIATLVAAVNVIKGDRIAVWEPSKR